jgi:hypothetical protein
VPRTGRRLVNSDSTLTPTHLRILNKVRRTWEGGLAPQRPRRLPHPRSFRAGKIDSSLFPRLREEPRFTICGSRRATRAAASLEGGGSAIFPMMFNSRSLKWASARSKKLIWWTVAATAAFLLPTVFLGKPQELKIREEYQA